MAICLTNGIGRFPCSRKLFDFPALVMLSSITFASYSPKLVSFPAQDGHNMFSSKACPCFDVAEYADFQLS